MSGITYMLKVILLLFKIVNYNKQFLIMGIIPNFKSLGFSTVKCYWSLIELGSI